MRKEVIAANFLSVVGVVGSEVPQLAVKLNVAGDAGNLTGLAARSRVDPTSTGQVLLSHVVGRPQINLVVRHAARTGYLINRLLSRAFPPQSGSVSEEVVPLLHTKRALVPVVTGLVKIVRGSDKLLRSSNNLVRRVANVLDLNLTVVFIPDD